MILYSIGRFYIEFVHDINRSRGMARSKETCFDSELVSGKFLHSSDAGLNQSPNLGESHAKLQEGHATKSGLCRTCTYLGSSLNLLLGASDPFALQRDVGFEVRARAHIDPRAHRWLRF